MALDLEPSAASISPLPRVLSRGLIPVATFGMISFLCSTSLFLYLTYRLISWKRHNRHQVTNQFVVLIYNLLFADIQQSLAFLLNINSLRRDGIFVGTSTCWAQAWFVSTGDLAGSVFISAIAIHTFLAVVLRYRIKTWCFYAWMTCCWTFVYLLGIIGPLRYGADFYTRAAAWCWVNHKYDIQRLYLHYLWMFILMFSTVIIYALISLFLHVKRHDPTFYAPPGARPIMLCYPLVYVFCTIPLAAGRIATLAGRDVSLGYFCLAGAMIACNGWLDVLLYGLTRSDLVFSSEPPSEQTGIETFGIWIYGGRNGGRGLGNLTTIEAGTVLASDQKGSADGIGTSNRNSGLHHTSRGRHPHARSVPPPRHPLQKLRGTLGRYCRRSESVEKLYGPYSSRRGGGDIDGAAAGAHDADIRNDGDDSPSSDSASMRRAFTSHTGYGLGRKRSTDKFDNLDFHDDNGMQGMQGIRVRGEVQVHTHDADEVELKQIAAMMRQGRKASTGDCSASSTRSVDMKM